MVRLIDLPNIPLQFVFAYLTVTDVLNLRSTCSKMFQTSKCKEFYEKVQICMEKIKETDLKLFQKLCEEFAIIIMFNTEGCFEERLEWILPCVKNVRNVLVNVRYLNQACRKLKYIKYLVINYIYSDGLKDSDIDFSCLSTVKKLDQLCIKGSVNNFQKLYLYQSMLDVIIEHTNQISKICFEDIDLQKGNEFAKSKVPLSKKIRKSSHIREWKMINVVTDDGIFDLPSDIRTLECRYTDCINFKVYKFDNLEKLVLESVKFENELFKFKNLKVLEITGHLRGDGLDGKTIVCPKLEIIRLLKIHHIGPFRELLTCESKKLHLTVIHDISKTEISWILQNKPPLNRNRVFTHKVRLGATIRPWARPVARQPEMAAKKTGKATEKSKSHYSGTYQRSITRAVARQPEMAGKKTGKEAEKSKYNYLGKSKIKSICFCNYIIISGYFKSCKCSKDT